MENNKYLPRLVDRKLEMLLDSMGVVLVEYEEERLDQYLDMLA